MSAAYLSAANPSIASQSTSLRTLPLSALCFVFCCCLALSLAVPPSAFAHRAPHDRISEVTFQLALAPDTPELYLTRAELHRLARHWEEALADLDRAVELEPRLAPFNWLYGRLHLEADNPQEALPFLKANTQEKPKHIDGWAFLARSLRLVGEPALAAAALEQAIQLNPTSGPTFYLELAETVLDAGPSQRTVALAHLESGLSQLGPLVVLEDRALELETDSGNLGAALVRVDRVLQLLPNSPGWHVRKAELLLALGQSRASLSSYRQARTLLEANPQRLRIAPARRALHQEVAARLSAVAASASQSSNDRPATTPSAKGVTQ